MKPKPKFFAPGVSLSVATFIALVILIFLGTWQQQKVGPKTDLLARIEAGMKVPPISLPLHIDNPIALEYQGVFFEGERQQIEPVHVFGLNRAGRPGYFIYAPVKRPLGLTVIVNFGWIPMDHDREIVLPTKLQRIQGTLVRSAVAGPMTPKNDPKRGSWYVADVHAIAAHFGLQTKEYYHFRIFVDQMNSGQALPLGGQVLVKISNNHFNYMLTWYGLGLALLGVYIVYGIKRGRTS